MPRTQINKTAAFTLVEVLVVAPLIILFIGAFIGLVVTLTGDSLKLRESNAAAFGVQDALDEMGTASGNALGFLTTTGPLVAPQGSGNNTAAFTNENSGQANTLIISSAATTKNPYDASRQLVYTGSSPCSSSNPVYSYTTVYFISGSSLYKRTILPASPAPCTTPWQKPSCEESRVASNPAVCKASDEKLLDNVAGMTITYYDSASSTTPIPASQAEDAVSVSIQLEASKSVAGETVNYSGSSRVKRGEGGAVKVYSRKLSVGDYGQVCAIADSQVYCWGRNDSGQVGNGTTTDFLDPQTTPSLVGGLLSGKTATHVVTSNTGSGGSACAIADGRLYCWGNNNRGQLGDGTTTQRTTPVAVTGALSGVNTVTKVVMAGQEEAQNVAYTCALASGNAYCWGVNAAGQLGDGTTTNRTSPTLVGGQLNGKTVTDIEISAYDTGMYSGQATTYVIADGQLYAWGEGQHGEIGNGTTNDALTPVLVGGALAGKTVGH